MATSNINVRVDNDLKAQAEALFSDLGLNMSTAIIMFLKSAVSHDGLPFEGGSLRCLKLSCQTVLKKI